MRRNQDVTQREANFPRDAHLITTTDKRGVITYANPEFIAVSGYQKDELLGKNHNLIRHPDMPAAAFKDMWRTIQSGHSWRGAVKNRCKNGDHYWVDAYVTPVMKNGEIAEYQSIRTVLQTEQKQRAERLYQQWRQKELPKCISASPYQTVNLLLLGLLLCLLGSGVALFFVAGWWSFLMVLPAIMTWLLIRYQQQQCRRLLQIADKTCFNPVMSWVYSGGVDFKSRVSFALSTQRQENRALMARLVNSSGYLHQAKEQAATAITKASIQSLQQHQSTDGFLQQLAQLRAQQSQVDAAVSEMEQYTGESEQAALAGNQQLQQMLAASQSMQHQLNELSQRFAEVNKQGEAIAKVVKVIREVAEQTNLLALNAAIEAARAGEMGRGFAVVADEIRALASRTHHSTHEIQTIIHQLYQGIQQADQALLQGVSASEQTAQSAASTAAGMTQIQHGINTMRSKARQISQASLQQLSTVEQLNVETQKLAGLAQSSAHAADEAKQQGDLLSVQLNQLTTLAQHFLHAQQKALTNAD
ncbi:methyl-accepting chemotaxis protein [Alkalimonas amylolytica]|uniref:Methyl-accepting chemotaxis sensory transducer with Pas/Pac sensor n=1 Tax=Alkalimonas amylolytica TaxID=152573 RepID=A0A1H3XV20_ALKAM|nr:PAS domain-containing methyl-accepting chemotaxis protein [Alkalimonas amylolytica]SEA03315.1 methyl-accepting chemotaxis sensory transducer with Pas/Pac sensor [Alkalimonas amylolytica]